MDRHKTYLGTPTPGREPAIVYVDEKGEGHILPKYTEHARYADQFGWGTNGPRCTQLAFAILTNHFNGDHHRARLYCHAFKYRTQHAPDRSRIERDPTGGHVCPNYCAY